MISTSTKPNSEWEDLAKLPTPNSLEWAKCESKTYLDLVLLALETLTGIGCEAMISAATNLNLESTIPDILASWQLRQGNPLHKSEGENLDLDVEQARALVVIICYLAKQDQELIRRAVGLLEQVSANNQEPHQIALLGEYIDAFCNTYQKTISQDQEISTDLLTQLALKLLIDLLFYSSKDGYRRLWLTLIDISTKEI